MGKRFPFFSFLCGVFTGRKKTAPPSIEDAEKRGEDNSESSPARLSENDTVKPVGDENPDQQQALPPPPGVGHHMRTVSCQHTRSNSGVSKLMSSLSLRVMGGGVGAGGGPGREEKSRYKDKLKFKHEDSIWKKTIILGEKCRVPDESEEDILYDEKGNKISTYHPKSHSGVLTFSRQTSCLDQDQASKR